MEGVPKKETRSNVSMRPQHVQITRDHKVIGTMIDILSLVRPCPGARRLDCSLCFSEGRRSHCYRGRGAVRLVSSPLLQRTAVSILSEGGVLRASSLSLCFSGGRVTLLPRTRCCAPRLFPSASAEGGFDSCRGRGAARLVSSLLLQRRAVCLTKCLLGFISCCRENFGTSTTPQEAKVFYTPAMV
jgi:hypothetical protein